MSSLLLSIVLTSISLAPPAAGQLWNWIPALSNQEWFSSEDAQQARYHPESAFVCFNAELPNITVYSTGGTITAAADSRFETTNYDSAILGVSTVIKANPTICETANIRPVELAREDSIDIKLEALKLWSQIIQDDLNNPFTQGAVFATGTDRLTEFAYFLAMTVRSGTQLVVTGASRPATAYNTDGHKNLLDSVLVVVCVFRHSTSNNHGVLILFSSRILPPRYTIKSSFSQENAFQTICTGDVGIVSEGKVQFYFVSSQLSNQPYFDVRKIAPDTKFPRVETVNANPGRTITIENGTAGVFVIGFGAGYLPQSNIDDIIKSLNGTAIPILVGSHVPGRVGVHRMDFGIASGCIPPSNALAQFELALWMGLPLQDIEASFEVGGDY
ncbi:Asparaginase/glutaminase [Dactylonectria macrodidyma]|uniref:Asparaginase/glutaminase n=1 Tax=Dactylonectria macrodidyma TaxID=307937 RepID=A0A9P9D2N7_9HYPO|nr:Asparaginase/glutaminase [Dactylonectria macrodidyma]